MSTAVVEPRSSGTDESGHPHADTAERVVLIVEYDGTRFNGSQLQAEGIPTVQGCLEDALLRMTGQRRRIAASSRTDTGVDARGQVVSFVALSAIPLATYESGLNHYLPRDITVTGAFHAPIEFDVRRDAVSRRYRYSIVNRRTPSALHRNHAAHVRAPLDHTAMAEAVQALRGWLDVRPFTGALPADRDPLRRFDAAEVTRDGEMVSIDIEASGFLPHQIRRTAGALARVGSGQMAVPDFHRLVREGAPGEATWTMPAAGLCLIKVTYKDFPPQGRTDDDGSYKNV